jgi:hypothetical protein
MVILTHTGEQDGTKFNDFKGVFDSIELGIEKYKEKENYNLSIREATEDEWISVEKTNEDNKYEIFHHYPNDKEKYTRGYLEFTEVEVNTIY